MNGNLQAYEEYLAFLHRLNDSVVGVHTTADMRCTDLVISFIDMLDKLEVREITENYEKPDLKK